MPSESEIIAWIRDRAGSDRIRKLSRMIGLKPQAGSGVVVGLGDDAAAFRATSGFDLLVCSDLSVEGVHFRTDWSSPEQIGYKGLAVTVSDVAAMGGHPIYALLNLALPKDKPEDFFKMLFSGIFELADKLGLRVIGGDTSSSPGPVFLDSMVIGECLEGAAVTRSGAKAGDLIFVTGTLGASALGLRLLQQSLVSSAENDKVPTWVRDHAIARHLKPEPLVNAGHAIGAAGLATSMIDISDGLSTDLSHILTESGQGAMLLAEAIPISEGVLAARDAGIEIDPLALALSSGEEYELLFTARPENRALLEDLVDSVGSRASCIGEIVADHGLKLHRDGVTEEIRVTGYEHSM
jgi:thiamine-monophosphate kinase